MQPLDNNTIRELIAKSIYGQPSEEEARQLYDWVQASDENRDLYVKIRDIDTYANMIACIDTQQDARPKSRSILKWGAMAAAVALLIVSSWLLYEQRSDQESTKSATASSSDVLLKSEHETWNLSQKLSNPSAADQSALSNIIRPQNGAAPEAVQFYTIVVPHGKTFEMTFNDGSHVALNAGSELKFPSTFTGGERNVTLQGEALFQVAPDPEKPFFVKTPQGKVKVLGTRFNVKSYPEAPNETISLLEGSIAISNSRSQQILKPGEQASLSATKITDSQPFNPDEVLAWKEGIFLFDNVPLEEVLHHVERWHNVHFELSDERIKNLPVYIKVRKERSINDLLKALETTNKIKFKQSGATIYVTP
ncbi:FecR family protein [Chitinophaga caseinilytica]|uniref:FecR family protein n=1 Tax=Chitinophaga caseinilytica TaxID=2267521 RepID=UPI003C302346